MIAFTPYTLAVIGYIVCALIVVLFVFVFIKMILDRQDRTVEELTKKEEKLYENLEKKEEKLFEKLEKTQEKFIERLEKEKDKKA